MTVATSLKATPIQPNAAPASAARQETIPAPRYLHGKWIDFFLLGGSSLLLIPFLFVEPSKGNVATIAFASLLVANFINHPHFAHSYQIFYRNFGAKLRDASLSKEMRIRYAVAGIAVPLVLVAYFAIGMLSENLRMVALGGNIMAFFVGWHYVKQGYGMLMVDCALKRQFFNAQEKNLLLYNAYAVWISAWLLINDQYSQSSLWGLRYATFAVPGWINMAGMAIVAMTSGAVLLMLARKLRSGARVPATGLVAYGVSLYLWTLLPRINPFWLLVIPALHSMQYLAVVYRFQTNIERDRSASAGAGRLFGPRMRLFLFAFAGLAIGAMLFWILPTEVGKAADYDRALFGPALFLFIFWVVVNVHHYFLDSVMWRRENPETQKHLFA